MSDDSLVAPAPSGDSEVNRRRVAPMIVLVVAAVLGGLFWVLAASDSGSPSEVGLIDSPLIGRPAPAVRSTTIDDEPFDLARRKGSWVVVNFFNSTCVPCKAEHPALLEFVAQQATFDDGAEFYTFVQPPGTGDIALSLSQYLPRGEVYVVTTPQPAAQKVAALSAAMAAKVNLPVKGIIENMSWFTGDDGKRYEIFGSGGGQELADELGVPLLGKLPLVPELREGGDSGNPIVVAHPESEAAQLFQEIARRIATEMKSKKIFSAALKVN